ncbi:MAG: ABC transporter ATP-binding protein [Opitutales bacterium]|nr:ABC transporter ATP-binding protein [Opitutales bacterium]MCH8540068.1 ABC transporter ATP-binding protein [Opitutales bacterium]
MKTDKFVLVENLSKCFPQPKKQELVVFDKVSFGIQKGEFICCIGHSGCGKSTIMNVLAGLEKPTSGAAILDGREIAGPGLEKAVVFQNHSLLPWKTVLKNVMFAVGARHPDWSRGQIREHSQKYLDLVGLAHASDQKPHQLSGGMKQRVGIARAFALESPLLLMDEPFGALDALTRGTIQEELLKIWGQTKQTVFMITHDVDEAILLSDRIFLMTNGPRARVAEAVEVSIPRPRKRAEIVHHPDYYTIRNHLVDFLVSRSKELSGSRAGEVTGEDLPSDTPVFPPNVDPVKLARKVS